MRATQKNHQDPQFGRSKLPALQLVPRQGTLDHGSLLAHTSHHCHSQQFPCCTRQLLYPSRGYRHAAHHRTKTGICSTCFYLPPFSCSFTHLLAGQQYQTTFRRTPWPKSPLPQGPHKQANLSEASLFVWEVHVRWDICVIFWTTNWSFSLVLVAQATHWAVPLFLLDEYKAEFVFLEKARLGLVSSSLVGKKASSLVSTISLPCLYSVM